MIETRLSLPIFDTLCIIDKCTLKIEPHASKTICVEQAGALFDQHAAVFVRFNQQQVFRSWMSNNGALHEKNI